MVKHLNETVFSSGVHTLFDSEAFHDTYYKQVTMVVEKLSPPEGGTLLSLNWKIAYVAKTQSKTPSFADVLQTKKSSFCHCLNCDSSRIVLVGPDA